MKHSLVTPALTVAVLAAVGCTWVEPTEAGYAVALVKSNVVQNCESVGVATVEVPDNIGPFARGDEKVAKELVTLAKNEAAEVGGDTIVQDGPVSNGRQRFRVYRCRTGTD